MSSQARVSHTRPYVLLQPLPILYARWADLFMDFITDLPKKDNFDSILVIVDRTTKMAHSIPCSEDINAERLASVFVTNVFRLHGLPLHQVSDRGPQFRSRF
jgi:hypothetical protein